MPAYRYKCNVCKKNFSIFLSYNDYDTVQVICPNCHSESVLRIVERIRTVGNDHDRINEMSNSVDQADHDPKALGKMMRQAQEQAGVKMDGPFDEVVSRLEKGESVEKIDKDYDY